jgi:predicted nucleic acid-binding protein
MIAVLDTNVLVSGILKPLSKSADILRLIADGMIQLAYDFRLLSEYREVLISQRYI